MTMTTSPLHRNARELSRRRFLRGTGVVMALPWLESLPVWGAEPMRRGRAQAARDSVHGQRRQSRRTGGPRASGAEMELGQSLEPLAPLKAKLNVINGLFNKAATGVGIHPGQTGNSSRARRCKKGAVLHGGISMDQVLASHIGEQTVQPSLVLGCEQPITGYHETNFSMAYSSHISWQTPTSPVPMEVYPSLAFDSLFDNRGSQRNLSILDRVQGAGRRRSAGRSAPRTRRKLDEYLTSVREVEKRAQDMRAAKEKADARAIDRGRLAAVMARPDNGLPEDIREHMRLMCDILALAFQTDKTRVATLLLCRDISGLFYPFLDVRMAHHLAIARRQSDDLRAHQPVTTSASSPTWPTSSPRCPRARRTVLDNSCLVFMSNMWSGSQHDSSKVPVLTAGSLGGTLETGRVLDYTDAGDENRKLCSFYLSLMDRMGVKLDRFGDATERLTGI